RGNVPVGYRLARFVCCALIVNVEVPPPVTDDGLKLKCVPAGNPLTEKFTLPLNPFTPEIVTEYPVEFPRTTVWLDGVALIEKPGATSPELNTKLTLLEWTRLPLVPVIVRG